MRDGEVGRARRRLRLWLGVFCAALALPGAVLVYKAYDQLKWESFRAQQVAAEDLAGRIDRRLAEIARTEDARPPGDYGFLAPGAGAGAGRRSPLADLAPPALIPGLLGWFQVAEDGRFSSPLLPEGSAAVGLDAAELAVRQAAASRIEGVLIGNRLVERGAVGAAVADRVPTAVADSTGSGEEETDARKDADDGEFLAQAPARVEEPARKEAPLRERLSQRAFEQLGTRSKSAPSAPGAVSAETAAAPAPVPVQGLGRVDELTLDSALARRAAVPAAVAPPAEQPSAEARPAESPPSKLQAADARPAESMLAKTKAAGPPPPPAASAVRAGSPPGAADKAEGGRGEALAAVTAPRPAPAKGQRVPREPVAPQKAPPPTARPARADRQEGARPPLDLFADTRPPLELGLLGSGHFVLFRDLRTGGGRVIQGLLIEQGRFLETLMAEPFRASPLARTSDLIVAFRGAVLNAFRASGERGYVASARELTGALLYRNRPPAPFDGLELIFSVGRLPTPPGALVIGWGAGLLVLVLLGGTWLMYRLGLRQIALVAQQQAFVSAVSHELRTPLTSIRLYAEMLRAGFADEARRGLYYRYIQEESERLSRLIANVLALSRIGRDALQVRPQPVDLASLIGLVGEKVASQVERAGFRLVVDCALDAAVQADPDACVQVLLNLVDNALKFAAGAAEKTVEVRCSRPRPGWVRIAVRDHGPGVARESRARIFELFYRGAEATAGAIPGTGIGLALVERLIRAMGGRVEVAEAAPGAEFRIELPAAASG